MTPELSIIIPAFNEASRLPATLEAIGQFMPGYLASAELLIVDDGSSDETRELVRSIGNYPIPIRLVRQHQNQGKGAAVRRGISEASGKYLLVTDADNSTPITELPRLWEQRSQAPIVLGSRYMAGSDIKRAQPLTRRLLSRGGNLLIRSLLGLRISDTQNGFKLLEGNAGKKIFSLATIDRWGYDIEILVIAKENKLPVLEIPVSWYDADGSKLRAGRAARETLKELLRIRELRQQGKYRS